ncbi:hypothetical protein BH20PSE1_BH20PSE1_00790 [soil metagenome]
MTIPYESATSGDRALAELQRILAKFGCSTFGTMTDAERGCTIVQFKWRGRMVALEASWKGYATTYLKAHPHTYKTRATLAEHQQRAMLQAQVSVCSALRDFVKGQITIVECGVMSFETAFGMHLLLPNGLRVVDVVAQHLQLEDKTNVVDLPQRSST